MIVMDVQLKQRGRASNDFLISLVRAGAVMEPMIAADITAAGVTEETLADDIGERFEQMERLLAGSRALGVRDVVGEWAALRSSLIAREAFEDIRPEIEPTMRALASGPTQIQTFDHFTPPDYLDGVWIHRTHGGWDGHEHQGFIHAEMIHKRFLNALYGGDIFKTRRTVLENLPRKDYKKIFEMGVSSGYHTLGLADAFPGAQISGCDVSRPMLEQAQRMANERGLAWTLYVGKAEDTRLPDASFDLVSSFILLHELPAAVNVQFFQEAFRLLEPGGAVIMTDVPPSWSQDKLTAWRYDRGAQYSGEPYWREAGLVDTAQIARDCGFVNVRAFKEPTGGNYWVTVGEKP
jgi:ubiquinone/menaquinone biosynthesis C-methylase UbiE